MMKPKTPSADSVFQGLIGNAEPVAEEKILTPARSNPLAEIPENHEEIDNNIQENGSIRPQRRAVNKTINISNKRMPGGSNQKRRRQPQATDKNEDSKEQNTTRLNVEISDDMKYQLLVQSAKERRPVKIIVTEALDFYLKRNS